MLVQYIGLSERESVRVIENSRGPTARGVSWAHSAGRRPPAIMSRRVGPSTNVLRLRFHFGRTFGRHHDHRHLDRAVVAGGAGGARGGAADAMQQQPQADRTALHNYHTSIGTFPSGYISAVGPAVPPTTRGRDGGGRRRCCRTSNRATSTTKSSSTKTSKTRPTPSSERQVCRCSSARRTAARKIFAVDSLGDSGNYTNPLKDSSGNPVLVAHSDYVGSSATRRSPPIRASFCLRRPIPSGAPRTRACSTATAA